MLLEKGIVSEADALYLMVEVRKLLEQQQAKRQYEYLTSPVPLSQPWYRRI
jgi:hypothetical protein